MAEAREAPADPETALAQQMLAELDAGDREVSQSEPVAPPAPSDVREDGQLDEAEASSENTDEPEAPTTEDVDAPDDAAGTLDLEWIDKQDSAYADFLTDLHEQGRLDEETFTTVKQAYQPRRGMNAAQKRAAEAEADATKWKETGKPLFDTEEARQDFLAWRESRDTPAEKTDPLDGLKERLQTALNEGTDEDFASTLLDVAASIADSKIASTRKQDSDAEHQVLQYREDLKSWGDEVTQHFVDIEGATVEDVKAAAQRLEAQLNRRGANAMDLIQSSSDLREEMADLVKAQTTERKFQALLGRQSERSKQYNGKSLKASSSPAVSSEVEEDLTTFEGRNRAMRADPDIAALLESLGDTL